MSGSTLGRRRDAGSIPGTPLRPVLTLQRESAPLPKPHRCPVLGCEQTGVSVH